MEENVTGHHLPRMRVTSRSNVGVMWGKGGRHFHVKYTQ